MLQDNFFERIYNCKPGKSRSLAALFFVYSLLLLFTGACSRHHHQNLPAYQFSAPGGVPDYSSINYWAAHPNKYDPSDSLPAPLRSVPADTSADVFFIHPTTLTDENDTALNARIDDALINAKTDYSSILYQASAFSSGGRVFAPRYRQAHYRCFFSNTPAAQEAFELAWQDVKTAFAYYLRFYNSGRPIIIAAHSQGTVHAARLLKEYFENEPLQHQLVCAYLVGMPVAETYFARLKPCTDSASTGCFVSWRTYKRGYTEPQFVAKENFRAIVTNPLTWRCDTVKAPRALNKGAVLRNFSKLYPRVTDARVHGNVLWVRKPKFFGNIFVTTRNYHIADINLFYSNIRQNVQTRLNAFLKR